MIRRPLAWPVDSPPPSFCPTFFDSSVFSHFSSSPGVMLTVSWNSFHVSALSSVIARTYPCAAGAKLEQALGVFDVIPPQPARGSPHEGSDQRCGVQRARESRPVGVSDHGLQ